MHRTLLLLLALKKWQLGFWSFCILLSIICPNCTRMWLFFFPYFLYFVAWGDICLGTSMIAKGPRSWSQPVSLLQTGVLQYLTSLEIRLKYSFPHEILPSAYHLDLNAAHWTILFGLLLKHYFTLPCVLIDFVHILLLYERQTYWGPGLYLHAASKWLTWYKACAFLFSINIGKHFSEHFSELLWGRDKRWRGKLLTKFRSLFTVVLIWKGIPQVFSDKSVT